jgi:general secretion pathway protein C
MLRHPSIAWAKPGTTGRDGTGSTGACRAPWVAEVPLLLRPSAARFPVVQAEVEEFVTQNTAGFLEVVRPQPFMPNGQLKGYRIYPGPNRQQFAALGLRAGDLITEINGVVLNNPAQGTEVFRSLGGATQVTVTLERDGQPQVLSLNLDQVSPAGGATQ